MRGNAAESKINELSVTGCSSVLSWGEGWEKSPKLYFIHFNLVPVTTNAGLGNTAILYPWDIMFSSILGSELSRPIVENKFGYNKCTFSHVHKVPPI